VCPRLTRDGDAFSTSRLVSRGRLVAPRECHERPRHTIRAVVVRGVPQPSSSADAPAAVQIGICAPLWRRRRHCSGP
jgi:hypothetical protein